MEKTITIFSTIGGGWFGGVTKEELWDALKNANVGTINVIVSSDGGDLSEGLAMHDFLKGFNGVVNTYATGIVASAATFPLLAGKNVYMTASSALMIHNASTGVYGNADDLSHAAEVVAKMDTIITDIYSKKSGQPKEVIASWMSEEKWFTPTEALAAGLIDEVRDLPKDLKITNSLQELGLFPKKLRAELKPKDMFNELTEFLRKHFVPKVTEPDNTGTDIMDELSVILNKTPEHFDLTKINNSIDALAGKILHLSESIDEAKAVSDLNRTTIENLTKKIAVLEQQGLDLTNTIENISTGVPVGTDKQSPPVADNFVKSQLNLPK